MKLLSILLLTIAGSFGTVPQKGKEIQDKAKNEKKYIAIYFCGSDWCSVCHKYKKETLSVAAVDSVLTNDFVYYTADFPQRLKLEQATIETNEFLAEKLNPGGSFPLLVITDSEFNVKKTFKRGMDNSEFLTVLKTLKEECSK